MQERRKYNHYTLTEYTYCSSCMIIKASWVADNTPLIITIHLYPPLSSVVTNLQSYHTSVWIIPQSSGIYSGKVACIMAGNFGKYGDFFIIGHCQLRLDSPVPFTMCMLNDKCPPIHHIKILQPLKICISQKFDPSKITNYMCMLQYNNYNGFMWLHTT